LAETFRYSLTIRHVLLLYRLHVESQWVVVKKKIAIGLGVQRTRYQEETPGKTRTQ